MNSIVHFDNCVCLLIFFLVQFLFVDGIDPNHLNIYRYPKSMWQPNEIVFALNLPFSNHRHKQCYQKVSGSLYNTPIYYVSAAAVAVADINNDPTLLPNHKLRYVWNATETDTQCDEFEGIRIQLRQMEIGVHGFVGYTGFTGNDIPCMTVAKNAAARNLPLFSSSCTRAELSEKKDFPTFARTAGINNEVSNMIVSLFEKLQWKKFAVVYGDNHMWLSIYNNLQGIVKSGGKQLNITDTFHYSYSLQWEDKLQNRFPGNGESGSPVFRRFLDRLPSRARIVLLLLGHESLQKFMIEAGNLGLTDNKYAFVAVHPFEAQSGQLRRQNYSKEHSPWYYHYSHVKSDTLKRAYQSLMVVIPEMPPFDYHMGEFDKRVRDSIAKEPFNSHVYEKWRKTLKQEPSPPPQAALLYDAVKLYAVGLNETIAKGESITNGSAIVRNIRGLKLKSITGQHYIVNSHADVQTFFEVLQFQLQNITQYPESMQKSWEQCIHCWAPRTIFKVVPIYNETQVNLTFQLKNVANQRLYWSHGLPKDEPDCGFLGERCPQSVFNPLVISLVTTGGTFVVLMAVVIVFLYRNAVLRKELYNQLWKIDYQELYFHDWKGASASSLGSLTSRALSMTFGTSSNQKYITAAIYRGDYVAIKKVTRKNVELTNQVLVELKQMRNVRHNNLNQFIGACIEPGNVMIVYQYAPKGSMQDILENTDVQLDTLFILSLVYDIVKGMLYLHSTDIKKHGNLKSSNCVVDSRWVLKITDYGLETFKNGKVKNEPENYNMLLWRAPELLRISNEAPSVIEQQKGDVYSFAIILQECQTRDGAWGGAYQDPEVIVERVRKASNPPFRPIVPHLLDGAEGLRDLMKKCWSEDPDARPTFMEVRREVEGMMKSNGLKTNIFDNMIYMMGKYSDNLEEIVADRTSSLIEEKQKVEALLERMLPKSVARQLMKGKEVEAETFEEVTIYFSDIVGFTTICSTVTPMEVVQLLNCLYTMFDRATKDYDVYKVETIGDAYMVVSGLPVRNGKQHIKEICLFALDILQSMKSFKAGCYNEQLKVRIGVHCGPVVAGVVGTTMPRYCLFGDTVNVAARMESTGEPLRIQVSSNVQMALEGFQGFTTESRGATTVKGKGMLETYWLTGYSGDGTDHRGSGLTRHNSRNLYDQYMSPVYDFIRESPTAKHIFPKPYPMTDMLSRSPTLGAQRKVVSDDITRRTRVSLDHIRGGQPAGKKDTLLSNVLSKNADSKKQHRDSSTLSTGSQSNTHNNNNFDNNCSKCESEQLLRSPVVSFSTSSEIDADENDPLNADFVQIKF